MCFGSKRKENNFQFRAPVSILVLLLFKVANHVVSRTLRTSNRTSQVRKSFITFVIPSRISCGKVQKKSYFSAQNCVKVSPEFAAVFQITSTN